MNFWQKTAIILTVLISASGVFIRFRNSLVWNPYWGYDGGAHLEYARTMTENNELPKFEENYAAWHEPLYYLLSVPFIQALGGFSNALPRLPLISAFLGSALFLASVIWSWRIAKNCWLTLTTAAVLAVLPPAIQVSMFYSNEVLAQLLIFLAIIYAASRKNPEEKTHAVVLGLLLGAALLTKLTAVLAVLAVFLWLISRSLARCSAQSFAAGIIICLIAFSIALPWFYYRKIVFHGFLNNPYEERLMRSELPSHFFTSLDPDIVKSPFWKSGSRSFWSMVLGLSFTDYDAIMFNPDKSQVAKDALMTDSSRVVTEHHAASAKNALMVGILLLPVYTIGLALLCFKIYKKRLTPDSDSLFAIFMAGSLGALIMNVIKSGALERGIVKTTFVLSAFIIATILAFREILNLEKKSRLYRALSIYATAIAFVYFIVTLPLAWI